MKDIYIDRFLKCNVSQGVVRLDFGRVENIDHDKNEISMSPSSRLIMPVDSFMHFAEQVEQLKEKLESQGHNGSDMEDKHTEDSEEKDMELKKSTDSVH